MEKTFAQKVKSELCEPRVERKCCAVAEAYGVLLYCRSFSPREIRISTACAEFAGRLPHLFKKAFGVGCDRRPGGGGAKGSCAVSGSDEIKVI